MNLVGDTHSDSCSSCIPHLSSSTPPPFFHPNPYTRISKLSSKMTKPSSSFLTCLGRHKTPIQCALFNCGFSFFNKRNTVHGLHNSNKRQQHCFKCLHYRWHYLIAIFSFPRIRLMIQNRTKIKNVEHIILLRCHLNSIWVLHYTCLNPPPAISILKSLHSHWRLSLQYQNQPKNLNAWKLILKGNEQM